MHLHAERQSDPKKLTSMGKERASDRLKNKQEAGTIGAHTMQNYLGTWWRASVEVVEGET